MNSYNVESCDAEESPQEHLLNISASQLVQLMTCAMKRKNSEVSPPQNSKKQCLSSSTSDPEAASNPLTITRAYVSKQALIERNEYLEKRVKHLETLNYNLQFGIVDSIKKTISESLEAQLKMTDLVLSKRNSKQDDQIDHNIIRQSDNCASSNSQSQSRQQASTQEETMIGNVTSTTTKSSDLPVKESCSSNMVVASKNDEEHPTIDFRPPVQTQATPSLVQYIKPENHCNEDGSLLVYQDRVLGMAHEIQTIVRESTNYKKLTNRLLNALFDREELACSTLTGKFKGEYEKEKLDEDTVNLIVQQAVTRFPGTSPTDVRIVISQNCKDKALRLQRKQAKMGFAPQ